MKLWKLKPCVIWTCLLTAIVLSGGCAGRGYLMLDYQLPMGSRQLEGQTVQLQIEDQRGAKAILSKAAAHQFEAFNDRFSLSWVMPDKERILVGEYDLETLFKNSFEKRLALSGAEISDGGTPQVPVLTIALKAFTIDLQGRKWIADVIYQATLSKPGQPEAKELVKGNAERIRVIGRKGADMVISEIFSDVVNRVDIHKMFQQVKLIP